MKNIVKYAEGMKIMQVLAPQDIAATETGTNFIDLDQVLWVTWLVQFGNMTSDATDTVTVEVEVTSDASSSSPTPVAFKYRLSNALGTDGWGAITAGSSDGTAIVNATLDNKTVCIDLDPASVQDDKSDARFARVNLTPVGPITLVSAIALAEFRYPANGQNSSS